MVREWAEDLSIRTKTEKVVESEKEEKSRD